MKTSQEYRNSPMIVERAIDDLREREKEKEREERERETLSLVLFFCFYFILFYLVFIIGVLFCVLYSGFVLY